jgi:mRNA interferase MazF
MPSTTLYKQGDVLLVPFPFTNQSAVKQRPAVILSSEAYNNLHPDVILDPITSQIHGVPDEVSLNDWQSAGLLKMSAVKPILSSFDAVLVKRQLGALSNSDLQAVRTLFKRILDFT